MRRLEDALHDLAEQDERLDTGDLITRIEQQLPGGTSTSVVALPGRPTMDTLEKTRETRRRPRWVPLLAAGGAALLLLLLIGLPILFLRGGDSTVVDESTTTVPESTTTAPPTTVAPIVDAWQRVGHEVMNPVVGLFDMTATESGLVAVGFDPGEEDRRQNGVIFTSEDGVTWTRLAEDDPALTLGAVLMYGVTEGGPGLVVVGMGCEDDTQPCPAYPTVWTSVDGTSWTRSSADADVFGESGAMLDVITTESGIIAAGSVGETGPDDSYLTRPTVWFSPDGTAWTRTWVGEPFDPSLSMFMPGFQSLTIGPDGRIVGAGTAQNSTGDSVAAIWVSADGNSWERVDSDSAVFGPDTSILDVTWGPAGYLAVGTEEGSRPVIWHSPDGEAWTAVDIAGQPFDTTGTLASVAPLESGYVAAGPHGFADQWGGWVTLWTSPDGLTWDRVHAIGDGYAMAIVATDAGIAVAGGMPYADDFHAAVWAGPTFDPNAPPPDPQPPVPTEEEEEELTGLAALEAGFSCEELAAEGLGYPDVVVYWTLHEMPIELDPDGNGIPCENAHPTADIAEVFGGPEALAVRLVSDLPAQLFSATGPAVDAGLVCASGTTEFTDESTEPIHGGDFRWEDIYTCDDGSGTFVIGADVFVGVGDDETGVWSITSGTGNYESLVGGGGSVTSPTGFSTWSDDMIGRLTIANEGS